MIVIVGLPAFHCYCVAGYHWWRSILASPSAATALGRPAHHGRAFINIINNNVNTSYIKTTGNTTSSPLYIVRLYFRYKRMSFPSLHLRVCVVEWLSWWMGMAFDIALLRMTNFQHGRHGQKFMVILLVAHLAIAGLHSAAGLLSAIPIVNSHSGCS